MEPALASGASSRVTLTSSSPPRANISTHPNKDFAFLVHDQNSISTNSAPDIDNKPLVRQRRRRTSPEDHAILEREFHRNPRPDREARRRIIDLVSLGDKEIHVDALPHPDLECLLKDLQIWFQNRRQKVRRKGASLGDDRLMSAGVDAPSISSPTEEESGSSSFLETSEAPHTSQSILVPLSGQSSLSVATALSEDVSVGHEESSKRSSTRSVTPSSEVTLDDAAALDNVPKVLADLPAIPKSPVEQVVVSEDATGKRNLDIPHVVCEDTATSALLGTAFPPSASSELHSMNSSSNSHSAPVAVRLSFTSAGDARLLAATETTPSPPRPHAMAPTPFATRQSLRRSYSAAGLSDFRASVRSVASTPGLSSSSQSQFHAEEPIKTAPLLQRQSSGRSRDSRSWEFWCDISARDSSAKHAEKEIEGNATHAIELVRSRSNAGSRRAGGLTTSMSRSGSLRTHANEHDMKRTKLSAEKAQPKQKPSLIRAHTGHEHLQASSGKVEGLGIFEDGTGKPVSPERTLRSPAGDSDKENRGPELVRRRHEFTKDKPQRRRPALAASRTAPSLKRGRSALSSVQTNTRTLDPEDDFEVAKFMRGSDDTEVKENVGDVDDLAVQGLLSLSQGNWR